MKKHQRDLAIVVTSLLGISAPMAMDAPETNYFHGVAKATEQLATSVFKSTPDKNTISCALGPVQILSTLHQALTEDESAKKQEIEGYLGHSLTAAGLKEFRSLTSGKESYQSLFLNKNYILPAKEGINQEAVKTLSDLGSTIVPLNFNNAVEAADTINGIVAEDTKGMIKGLANPGQFGPLTKAVFLSTLYVKSKWQTEFYNRIFEFNAPDEKKVLKGFQGKGYAYFIETNNDQFLTIPTEDKIYLMIKLSKQAGQVSPITTAEWDQLQASEFIDLTMPNFIIENTLNLTGHLMESLPTLLTDDPNEDFQTTLTDMPLHITTFLQKNKIVVNKDGLEAASATMMCMKSRCLPPKIKRTIVVDRPFSFLLVKGIGQKTEGGSKDFLHLFSGTVMDPTQGS